MNTLNRKKVLITGGLGFIGSNLAIACDRAGASVTNYDVLLAGSGANRFNISSICNDVETIIADVRNADALREAVINKHIIIHCAAFTSHRNSMEQPLEDIDSNTKGTITLLETLRRYNPKAMMIYIGTSTQVGRMVVDPITELHPEFPLDIYSASKSAGEKYALLYAHAYDLDVRAVRLVNIFGPRANIINSDLGFINFFIGLVLQNKQLTVYGDGEQLRNVLYVDDAVDAVLKIILTPAMKGEVVFAASDSHYSVKSIAQEICRSIGGTVRFPKWPKERKIIEAGDVKIDNSKIKKMLDWKPETPLAQGLKKTKEYYRACLSHYL